MIAHTKPGNLLSTALAYSTAVLVMIILMSTVAGAASDSDTRHDGAVRATLDSGLRVVIVRNTLAPVVTTVLSYLAGSNESPKGFPGTAHAQEHMMFRGSPGLSAGQLANITAAMGGMFNASTHQNATSYYFTVPSEDLEVVLRIESIRMRGTINDEELWRLERGAMEQEVDRNLSDPEYVLFTEILERMFRGTPYAQTGLGTRESLDRTTAAMLRKFHDDWYAPNNAILVIVGNVQPMEALEKVRTLFGDIPARGLPVRPPVQLGPVAPETIRLTTDKPDGLVTVTFPMPGYGSPDYAAAQVLESVLNSRRGKLYALVPQGRALSVEFQMYAQPEAGLGQVSASFSQGADEKRLLDEVFSVLLSVKSGGVEPDMVEAAKLHTMAAAEFQKSSISGLALAWSFALAVKGRHSLDDDVKAISRVTVEDVNRVARRYIDLERSITAILTPDASGSKGSPGIPGSVQPHTAKQSPGETLPDWALDPLNRTAIPASTLDPVVSDLPGGIRLIVQSVTAGGTVNVYGRVRNNPHMEMPPGKEGVHEVLARLFDFGTTSMDREQFHKALDDIGAQLSSGTDFRLMVLEDKFDRGVQLLAESLLHPALPEKAFETVRGQEVEVVAGRLGSPGYKAERALKSALLPEGDPGLRQAAPETVSSLTWQDVKDYYSKVFRPDMTTIVVIGRVTPEAARSVVEKYFGPWKAPEGPRPETLLPPVPLNGPSGKRVPNAHRIQDRVTLAQTLGLNRSHPDYYALQLGNRILGGGFYATRLYRDLRQNAGLVYNVSTSFSMTQTRGFYTVQYGCEPADTSKARAIVERNLMDMQTALASAEEIQRAKVLLLREIPLSESSVDTIGWGLIGRTELGLPLDEPVLAARRYVELGPEQVREAFARWIRVDDLVQVVEGPETR